MPRVLELLERRLTPRPSVVRFGVVHTGAPEVAERVRTALVAAYRPRDCFVTLATGVLGTHVGAGAWAIFYQVEDGTPARLDAAPGGDRGIDRHAGTARPVTPRIPEALRLALDAIHDLKGSRAGGTRLAGTHGRHRFLRHRVRNFGRPCPRHRRIGHGEARPQGAPYPPRRRPDRADGGYCWTSWISWSTCSTPRPARSISSSGSGATHRSC